MKIKLIFNSPLSTCSWAIRTCYESYEKGDNGGEKDKELINRVGNQNKHSSVLEHLVYSFYIEGISRACLQELARHRMSSFSVKSTRYTLKELKNEEYFVKYHNEIPVSFDEKRLSKYCVIQNDYSIDLSSALSLDRIINKFKEQNCSCDIVKYMLPESYKTNLTWTINARSLQNFLHLRTGKAALKEIRDLAFSIFKEIPDEHKFVFESFINKG